MVTVKQVLKSQAYLAAGIGLLPVLRFYTHGFSVLSLSLFALVFWPTLTC